MRGSTNRNGTREHARVLAPHLGACNTARMDDSGMKEISLERGTGDEAGVVRLTLNRPDKLNAQTVQMWNHLARLGKELMADDSIRVLVVAGAGRSFSAGIDITTFTTPSGPGVPAGDRVRVQMTRPATRRQSTGSSRSSARSRGSRTLRT